MSALDSIRSRTSARSSLELRIAVAALVDATGTGCFLAGSALFFTRELGLRPELIGVGLTLCGVIGLTTTIPWGRAADRWGARPVLVLMQCVRGLAFALYAVAGSFAAFLAISALLGVADKAAAPVQQALIAEVVGDERRQQALAFVRATRNIGFAMGALLAAAAVSAATPLAYDGIVLFNAASFAFVAALTATLRDGRRQASQLRPEHPGRRTWRIHDRRYTALTGLNGVLTMHMSLLSIGLPLWLLRHTRTPAEVIPLLLVINAVVAVALQVSLARRVRSARAAAAALIIAGVALAGCCVAMPVAAALDPRGAAIVAVAAVLALTLAELAQSAGGWEISFRLAPADRRGQYLSVFSLGQTAQTMIGPVALTAAVFALGTLGWAVLAATTLGSSLLVPVVVRSGQLSGE